MAKETLAGKMAKKAFESPLIQKSWAAHMQAFGPILEPAFAEDYQSRVHLTAALNHISNHNFTQGLAKLKGLQDACVTDADKTAFLFFMGVCSEMQGNQEQMLVFYTYANEYEHAFFLPYLKVAKVYLSGCMYDKAEENFRAAIRCLGSKDDRERMILASAYANLATCLTMMHRYYEAEDALSASAELYPNVSGYEAIAAILHAVRGNVAQMEKALDALKEQGAAEYEEIKARTEQILNHADPAFYGGFVDEASIAGFWRWFGEYESQLQARLEQEEYEAALTPVADGLLDAFPFLEEAPYIALGQNEAGYVLELKDLWAIGIMDAYEKLLQACPEAIRSRWQFAVVH